jgi:ABC-type cobalamin transport system ATPase subunit
LALLTTIATQNAFGPLQANFSVDLEDGYSAFVGSNNVGKSSILQLMFRMLVGSAEFGPDAVSLVLADRPHLATTTETGGRVLADYNRDLTAQLTGSNLLPYSTYSQPQREELARLLLNHTDFHLQLNTLEGLLDRLGLPRLRLQQNQAVHFSDIQGFFQGSGLRNVFPILAALTDPQLRVILIDEPEISLEPTLQKALKNLLIEEAPPDGGKAIVVSTQSHLFTNRDRISSNYIVSRDGAAVVARAAETDEDLVDVTFRLLGNSTEDLFFPGNYLVVEGGSDQTIVERALELLEAPRGAVKVLSAGGIDAVRNTLTAVTLALRPLIVGDSPYADRVVAMIDAPHDQDAHKVEQLRKDLGDRLVELDHHSLEQEIPEELYVRGGLDRDELFRKIEQGNYVERREVKAQIAQTISGLLTLEDLDSLPRVKEAAELALQPLPRGQDG